MKQTPLLILGDGPQQGTGLARIVRDIATRAAAMPEFRVGTFGRLGHYSRHLPYYQYNFHPSVESQWGELELEAAWQDFAGQERGVVLTVWDATRLTWLGMPQMLPDGPLRQWLLQRPFKLWGYFPVDSTAPDGTIGALGRATVAGFDRVMAYSQFGAQALNTGDWCPHGLDMGVWKPRGRAAGREMLRAKSGGRLTLCDDDVLVGVVATNQPRKDWGLVAATCALLKQHYGRRFRAWWHVDTLERSHSWNMLALLRDFGLGDSVMLVVDEWRDAEMARAYSACNVTLAPGMEGFGYPACFTAGTLVETVIGPKPIETIRNGDVVLTHEGRWRRVTATMARWHEGNIRIVQAKGTHPLHVTLEHPFLDNHGQWKTARSLHIGHRLFAPHPISCESWSAPDILDLASGGTVTDGKQVWCKMGYSPKTKELCKINRFVPIDEYLCRWLGLYVAEGSASANGAVEFSFHSSESDYIDAARFGFHRFGISAKVTHKKAYPGTRVIGCSTVLAKKLAQICGSGARAKRVPEFIFTLPPELITAFLAGLFQGDGCARDSRLQLTTSSCELGEGVASLLRRIGYYPAITHSKRKWRGQWRNETTVNLHGDQARKLAPMLGMELEDIRKTKRVNRSQSFSYSQIHHGWFVGMHRLTYRPFKGMVYNLEVEEDHSYVVQGLAVHNCESQACGTPVVTGAGHGGSEFVTAVGGVLMSPVGDRIEGPHNMIRHIHSPENWKNTVVALVEDDRDPRTVSESVRYLGWETLWPGVMAKWLRMGLR